MKNKKLLSILIALLSLMFCCGTSFSEMVSIKTDDVNIRKGPGKSYAIIWEYGKGFPLEVMKRDGEWLKTKDFEGDQGWVHSSLVDDVQHLIVKANKNSKNSVNVRKSANTASKVVAHAKYGVVFKTVEQHDGWAKVKHEEKNIEGWIKRSLLWGF